MRGKIVVRVDVAVTTGISEDLQGRPRSRRLSHERQRVYSMECVG